MQTQLRQNLQNEIEPREVADYEVYSDGQLKKMLKEDELPVNLAKKVAELWPDLA